MSRKRDDSATEGSGEHACSKQGQHPHLICSSARVTGKLVGGWLVHEDDGLESPSVSSVPQIVASLAVGPYSRVVAVLAGRQQETVTHSRSR